MGRVLRVRAPQTGQIKQKEARLACISDPILDVWNYDASLKDRIPVLLAHKPFQTFRFLCSQLETLV